jgi:hypothetical protein
MGEFADYEIDRLIDEGFNPARAMRYRIKKTRGPACPKCDQQPKVTHTKFGWRRDCCGLWGWGESAPLVDKETHEARSYAHKVFDSLWQSGLVDRSRAYALLAQELGLTRDECHMKIMDKETARRVPAAAHEIGKRLKGLI